MNLAAATERTGLSAARLAESCPDCGAPEICALHLGASPAALAYYCARCGWINGPSAAVQAWFAALHADDPDTIPPPIKGGIARARRHEITPTRSEVTA